MSQHGYSPDEIDAEIVSRMKRLKKLQQKRMSRDMPAYLRHEVSGAKRQEAKKVQRLLQRRERKLLRRENGYDGSSSTSDSEEVIKKDDDDDDDDDDSDDVGDSDNASDSEEGSKYGWERWCRIRSMFRWWRSNHGSRFQTKSWFRHTGEPFWQPVLIWTPTKNMLFPFIYEYIELTWNDRKHCLISTPYSVISTPGWKGD